MPKHPLLYQINTRVGLTEMSRQLGRQATLDDIHDGEIDLIARMGFTWVWLLSVWKTGLEGRRISRTNMAWRDEFQKTLPDLCDDDITGSGFAITDYSVPDEIGGDAALARLRARLNRYGLKLMLDFVPNHTGLDHPWVNEHPEYYVAGTEIDLARAPQNYARVRSSSFDRLLAHGRDPNYGGWVDTLQLNYANREAQAAMIGVLEKISQQCDGLRCDMAMLVLPEVFERTWGVHSEPFWDRAIERVRARNPEFCFMAEVYWDLEWTMQQLGFDYAYDKRLYDRLHAGRARPIREHLAAGLDYQTKLARFLENHDELRAAAAFPRERHPAAAILTYLVPGMRFFHQGQLTGYKKKISPHLCRGPVEEIDPELHAFYDRLLSLLRKPIVRVGNWELLGCHPAWEGNWTHDNFVAFAWHGPAADHWLVVVNYSEHESQCRLPLPFSNLREDTYRLSDFFSEVSYDRSGEEISAQGLYLDMPAWKAQVFSVTTVVP